MKSIVACIEALRRKLERHRRDDLKEYPTRTIFVDPMLDALGWDVRDPDEVGLGYTTIDGKFVDYAAKINLKAVLFIEAKPLKDSLTDVKAITQVVGYAANAGIEWCILTNGVTYKVFRATEKAEAPDKLLFEVSIDPRETEGLSDEEVAGRFARFSRDAMERGVLDEIGEQIFTTGKVRKALDKLFLEPPSALTKLVRSVMEDDTIKPIQIKKALRRLWFQTSEVEFFPPEKVLPPLKGDYGEEHHLKGRPSEVSELFRALDRFCIELDPGNVRKKHLAKYIKYSHQEEIFSCVHVLKGGLRVWLKLKYSDLKEPPSYVRDVSNTGHWGVGDVEIAINSFDRFQSARDLIKESYKKAALRDRRKNSISV